MNKMQVSFRYYNILPLILQYACLIIQSINARMLLLLRSLPNQALSCALQDAQQVRIYPDKAIDLTIPLPTKFLKLFDIVASQLLVEEAFLFWLVKCRFNAGSSIDNHFEFYRAIFGRTDEDIRSVIQAVLPAFNKSQKTRYGVAEWINESDALKLFNSTVVRYSCNYQP